MSALGELLLDCGVQVTGCDQVWSSRLEVLRRRGMAVWAGHDAGDHTSSAGSVVYTAAMRRDHPEITMARSRGLTVVPRSLVLARLTRALPGVCIVGSHGKSTVTALVACILAHAGHDPGYLVGGVICGEDRGGCAGSEGPIVMETDEFDRTIERVRPHLGVITNIEPEHLDVYRSLRGLTAAFGRFASRATGGVVVWVESSSATPLNLPRIGHVTRCGLGEDADIRPVLTGQEGSRYRVSIRLPGAEVDAALALQGVHNVSNATLAAAAAWRLGASAEAISVGLSSYPGLERRYELLARCGECELVTDYAHHPTEIRATLATAAMQGKPVVAVFQPHLYSRTALLFEEFARSFHAAERVLITPIYAAREQALPHVSSALLVEAIRAQGVRADYMADVGTLRGTLTPLVQSPVVIVFLSAGDLDGFARTFAGEVRPDAHNAGWESGGRAE